MATAKLLALTILRVINNFTFSTGSVGTLIIFNELHPSGDRKDSNITHSVVGDVAHVPESEDGWSYDEKRGDAIPPIVTKKGLRKEEREEKLKILVDAGVSFNV